MGAMEIAANTFNAASIAAAGRKSIHTWWLGIVGCALFAEVFFETRLYADVALQTFFIATSALGWWRWLRARGAVVESPIRKTRLLHVLSLVACGCAVALGYAWLLHRFTDAYAPVPDSMVLVFSVLGQLLLVARRLETWWFGLVANTISVPLYGSRGLFLTALVYAAFWVNALVSLLHWRRLERTQ
jgi:nicotinamide mononucleotide transporter